MVSVHTEISVPRSCRSVALYNNKPGLAARVTQRHVQQMPDDASTDGGCNHRPVMSLLVNMELLRHSAKK